MNHDIQCPECGDTVTGLMDGYCIECAQAWELETCLHCGQGAWVNVWGECGQCESDLYRRFREGGTVNGATYEMRVRFTTDRPLTEAERVALLNACAVQIDDPADLVGESRRAGFVTSIIAETLEGVTE